MAPDSTITDDAVLCALQRHVGHLDGIHVGGLVRLVTGSTASAAHHERRVRAAVTRLRLAGHCICGQPDTGYFMAATPEELHRTCAYLRNRALTTLQIEARLRRLSLPELLGQLALEPAAPTESNTAPATERSTTP